MSQSQSPSSVKNKQSRVKMFSNSISFENAILGYAKLGTSINNWGRAPAKQQLQELIDVCVTQEDVAQGETYLSNLILDEFKTATRDFEEEEEMHISKGASGSLTDGVRTVLQTLVTKENLDQPLTTLKSLLVEALDKRVQEIKFEACKVFEESVKGNAVEILEQLVYKISILEDEKANARKMYDEVLEDNKKQKKRNKELMDELAAERAKNTKSTGNDFEGDLKRKIEELEELQRKFDKAALRIKELEDANAKQKKDIQALNSDIDRQRAENKTLSDENDKHTATIRERDTEIEDLNRQIKDLQKKNSVLTADKATLEKSLASVKEELDTNLKLLEEYREKLLEYRQRNSLLKDKIAIDIDPTVDEKDLQKQIGAFLKMVKDKDALEKELLNRETQIKTLEDTVAKKDKEIQELNEEIERLRAQLEEKEKESAKNKDLRDEIERLSKQIVKKNEDIKKLGDDKRQLQTGIDQLEQEIEALKESVKEVDKLRTKIREKESQIESLDKELKDLKSRLAKYSNLEKILVSVKDELAEKTNLIEEHTNIISIYKKRGDILSDKLRLDIDPAVDDGEFQRQLDKILKEKEALEKDAVALRSLRDILTKRDKEIENLNAEIERLNDLISQKDEELAKSKDLADEIDQLKKQLAKKTEDLRTLNEDKVKADRRIVELNDEIIDLNEKVREAEARYDELQNTYTRESNDSKNRIAALEKENRDIQNSLYEAQREIQRLKNQYSKVDEEINALKNEISDLKAQRTILFKDIENVNKNLEILRELDHTSRLEVSALRGEKNSFLKIRAELETKIMDLTQSRTELESEKMRLERELVQLNYLLLATQTDAKEAKEIIDQVKAQRDELLQKLTAANKANEILKDQIRAASAEADIARTEKNFFYNQVSDLEERIRGLTRDRDALEQDKTSLEKQVRELKSSESEALRDLENFKNEYARLKKQRDGLLEELRKANRHVDDLTQVNQANSVELNKLRPENTKLYGQVQDLERERSNLQKRLQEAEKLLSYTQDDLTETKRVWEIAVNRSRETEEWFKSAEKDREEFAYKERVAKCELEALRKMVEAPDRDRDHYKTLFNIQLGRANELSINLDKLTSELKNLRDEYDKLKLKFPLLERERDYLIEQLGGLKTELEAVEKQREDFSRRVERLEFELVDVSYLKKKVIQDNKSLQDAVFNEGDQKERQIEKVIELTNKLDQNLKTIAEITKERDSLSIERDYLRRRVEDAELNASRFAGTNFAQKRVEEDDRNAEEIHRLEHENEELKHEVEELKRQLNQQNSEPESRVNEFQLKNAKQAKDKADLRLGESQKKPDEALFSRQIAEPEKLNFGGGLFSKPPTTNDAEAAKDKTSKTEVLPQEQTQPLFNLLNNPTPANPFFGGASSTLLSGPQTQGLFNLNPSDPNATTTNINPFAAQSSSGLFDSASGFFNKAAGAQGSGAFGGFGNLFGKTG